MRIWEQGDQLPRDGGKLRVCDVYSLCLCNLLCKGKKQPGTKRFSSRPPVDGLLLMFFFPSLCAIREVRCSAQSAAECRLMLTVSCLALLCVRVVCAKNSSPSRVIALSLRPHIILTCQNRR